jgi:hypothetical protein
MRYELGDYEWTAIKPMLPKSTIRKRVYWFFPRDKREAFARGSYSTKDLKRVLAL